MLKVGKKRKKREREKERKKGRKKDRKKEKKRKSTQTRLPGFELALLRQLLALLA